MSGKLLLWLTILLALVASARGASGIRDAGKAWFDLGVEVGGSCEIRKLYFGEDFYKCKDEKYKKYLKERTR